MDELQYNSQNRIHPAVKRLIGKKPLNYEPYRTRHKVISPSGKIVKKGENITIKEDPSDNETVTNYPEISYVSFESNKPSVKQEKFDDALPVRNREKSKYHIIVGNISKWVPASSSQDNSTHKWMVYVRGPKENPDITHIVKKVRFFLHPSYQPNDIVDIQ